MPKKEDEDTSKDVVHYEHPVITAYPIDSRKIDMLVKLAAPVCPVLDFSLSLTPSTKILVVAEKIRERHGHTLKDVRICINRYHPDEILSHEKTFEGCGVTGGEILIYYDFDPITDPLLE